MFMNPVEIAQQLMQNPNIQKNKNAQAMLGAIINGDSARGIQIAQNLCNNYGIQKEQGMQQAQQFANFCANNNPFQQFR